MKKHTKKTDTMKVFLQKQPYNLTMAKHTLGIHQMRIMARTIEALQTFMSFDIDHTQKKEDVWAKVKVSELIVGNNVKPLRDALDGIMKKVVRIIHYLPEKEKYLEVGTPIVKEYKYEHGSSFVELQISGHLLPQIIDLARGYTKYSVDVAFKTSSPNVFKLYQYISHFKDKKQIQCNVDTLRQWLRIEDKYNKPAHINQRILAPAMQELKEKADVWFDIAERIKDGRRMIGWKFNIYTKDKPKKKSSKKIRVASAPKHLSPTPTSFKMPGRELLENTFMLSEKQMLQILCFFKTTTEKKRQKMWKLFIEIQWAIRDKKIHTSVGGYVAKTINETFKGDLKI